ncbi:uncharacterized protein LOC127095095 [Lathyrus oleraceus]|uniref:uncharacterized protein LOC127095095 n=1 Tax=Pisum sativum TaxID=3888 RepID=UPI0021D381F4|nr:uncharacterized protein LOC127095095 [Pisum sativum]
MFKPQDHGRFEYSSSKDLIGINCRTFEYGLALLPTTPLKPFDGRPNFKIIPKSTLIPINANACRKEIIFYEDLSDRSILLSKLWAGPAYSNSSPLSSRSIPMFSVRPKRNVSLDLPGLSHEIKLRVMAKSAPSSPTRERLDFTRELFVNVDSATKTLCRILNLKEHCNSVIKHVQ